MTTTMRDHNVQYRLVKLNAQRVQLRTCIRDCIDPTTRDTLMHQLFDVEMQISVIRTQARGMGPTRLVEGT